MPPPRPSRPTMSSRFADRIHRNPKVSQSHIIRNRKANSTKNEVPGDCSQRELLASSRKWLILSNRVEIALLSSDNWIRQSTFDFEELSRWIARQQMEENPEMDPRNLRHKCKPRRLEVSQQDHDEGCSAAMMKVWSGVNAPVVCSDFFLH